MSLEFLFEVPVSSSNSLKKIDRFSRLENGWRFGEGVAATPKVAERARRLVNLAESMGWETDVFPGVSGELLVESDSGDRHYEFIFEVNDTLTLIRTENGQDVERISGCSDNDAVDRIRFQSLRCVTSAYFIPTTGQIKTGDDLADWHFVQAQHPQTGFLSFIQIAQQNTAEPSATIFQHTIGSGTRQPYSGLLRQMKYVPRDALKTRLLQEETSGVTTTFTISETIPQRRSFNPIGEITSGETTEFAVLEDISI